jgi:Peptidase family M48
MRPALLVFAYALAVAWYTPALLGRLTARGVSARLGIAAWLTAMLSSLACATAAVGLLVCAAVRGWPGLAEALCRSVAGGACTPEVYRGALFESGLAAAAVVAALTAATLAWRYGRSVQRAQRRTQAHADLARLAGRETVFPRAEVRDAEVRAGGVPDGGMPDGGVPDGGVPDGGARTAGARTAGARTAGARDGGVRDGATRNGGAGDAGAGDAVVLDAAQPVAYCLPGRPATIVVSSGALALLDTAQLNAVLAHERAHLAGRHHLLTALTRGLAVTFPGVPLFTRGPAEVARLAEMRADDAAVRHSGRGTLVAALLAMGTGTAVPAAALGTAALGATGLATTARVQRLLEPPRRSCLARYGAALASVMVLLALASILITEFSSVIVGHGITLG